MVDDERTDCMHAISNVEEGKRKRGEARAMFDL